MADNLKEIVCPACGKVMTKVYMPDQGINLDVCLDGCGGIYFDNREFLKFDEKHEDIEPLIKVFEGKSFTKTDETEIRICPACGTKMVKNFASAKHEIQVDECYQCGGKFLDYSELDKIRAQYDTEEARVADVLKELYSKAGVELAKQQSEFDKLQSDSSVLTKIIRIKSINRNSKYITEEEILNKLNNNY